MVWRKIIFSFLLICCLLLVAASGSPAKAAENVDYFEFEVPNSVTAEALEYFRSYLVNHPIPSGLDYVVCSPLLNAEDQKQNFVLAVGHFEDDGVSIYGDVEYYFALEIRDSVAHALDASFLPKHVRLNYGSNYVPIIYSNLGNHFSIYESGDTYVFTTNILLALGICCYLLRSIFSFCLRRRD